MNTDSKDQPCTMRVGGTVNGWVLALYSTWVGPALHGRGRDGRIYRCTV